jgi:hypothetical protein
MPVEIAGKATQNGQTTASSSWASFITEGSQRFGVPEHWIRAVMPATKAQFRRKARWG